MNGNHELQRAWELMRLGRPKEAAQAATRHLAAEPASVDAHIVLALAQSALDAAAAAVASAEHAVHLDPERAHSHYVLAAVQAAAGRAQLAHASVARALELAPEMASAHDLMAKLLLGRGDRQGALAAADRAVALAPNDPDHHCTRGRILLRLGMTAAAATSVDNGLRLAPGDPDLHRLQGELLLAAGQVDAALHSYLTVLRVDPADGPARKGLLEALRGRNRVYRVVLLLRQGMLALVRQHHWLLLMLAFGFCAGVLTLLTGASGANVLRGALVAVLLVPAEVANLFLLMHPIGKHALTRTEKVSATLVGAALLAAAVLSTFAWLRSSSHLREAALACGGGALVLSGFHALIGHRRIDHAARVRIAVLIVIAIALVVIVIATR